MTSDTARKAVDIAAAPNASTGIIFFGGEPLLHKDLIYETIEYCNWKTKHSDCMFHYKVTTNGLLMDNDFIEYSLKNNIFIALSHDGIEKAHDMNRVTEDGAGTFDKLLPGVESLLERRPYAPVLMVVNPNTVSYYAQSVKYLYNKGFKYIICSLNYAAKWSQQDIECLREQYGTLAKFYYDITIKEEKFYLSPFEVKISSHINSASYCIERCELGKKQISVAPDGTLYPCVQFVGEHDYSIGNVSGGIDEERRFKLYRSNEEEKQSCTRCAIRKRCNHHCGCLNKQATGSIETVSPVLCAHERLLLPIADKLAEKLYRKRNAMFIQKHYNDMFPLVSLIEDKENLTCAKTASGQKNGNS
jgi:uncharacterized protein